MKDKNLAAVLAFFGGWIGLHRFYLGQVGLAFLYFIPFLGSLLGVIDAIAFLTMDQKTFDLKYNQDQYRPVTQRSRNAAPSNDRERRYQERQRERDQRERSRREARSARSRSPRPAPRQSTGLDKRQSADSQKVTYRKDVPAGTAERKAGLRYFRDFEYDRAIESFQRAIELNPRDVASHFNLAASYSCEEEADKAFYHLDRAVALGFEDFERIRAHDSFAFLRIQDGYDDFAESGFRLAPDRKQEEEALQTPVAEEEMVELPEIDDNLLDQLQRLATLKEKGLLTEIEFAAQKKRLLG